MNKNDFIKELELLGVKLSNEQLNKLDMYCDFLLEYNKHTNLTAIKDKEQVYLKHFYDSLTIVKAINLNEYSNLLDIGSGAGFPGMVIKIVFPNLEITLLDSNNKKIKFLQELAQKLNLNNKLNFYHGRAEEFCKKNREKFDIVTARAVSNMSTLSELCIPLVKTERYFIALKGSNIDELNEATNGIKKLGGLIEKIVTLNLPIEESKRHIIVVKKINKTPNMYPRRYEKIIKNPLK